MAHEFPISVADLDAGGRPFKFPVRPAWVRGVFEGHEATASTADGKLAVRASKSGHDVVIAGTLDMTLSVPCARCLASFDLPLHADLQVLYVPAARIKAPQPAKEAGPTAKGEKSEKEKTSRKRAQEDEQEYEFTSEEADTLGYDGETVVLDDLVRDELLLEIPMIPLCSEACPGMSPAPGEPHAPTEESHDPGIDPRLAPLLQFRARAKEPKS